MLILILPATVITAQLARQAGAVYQRVQSGDFSLDAYLRSLFAALPMWLSGLLENFGLGDFDQLVQQASSALSQGSQVIATKAVDIGQYTFDTVVALFITLYLAYFLIRDGDVLARSIRRAIPLAPEHKHDLIGKFTTVIRATVKGNLLVAVAQGALGGLAFWFLGVSGPLLWAVLMSIVSLLPAVGAAIVWLPVALWFLVNGQVWQGVSLIVWGVVVIGLVDNLLRPVLVGKDTRMPDWLVLITTVGGIAVVGINGFVIGPAIAAMFIAVWHIFTDERPR